MTNFEKITDNEEELTKFILTHYPDTCPLEHCPKDYQEIGCEGCLTRWMKQEAEE